MLELDAAVQFLHLPDADLEVEKVTIFVEGATKTPSRPRPTIALYDGTGPTPLRCRVQRVPQGAHLVPRPLAGAPRSWAHQHLSPPLPRTRGAHHRGQVLCQERPGTPMLLPVVATRRGPERVLGANPIHLYGASPVPRPPLPAPEARDGVHSFGRTQEVTAVTGVHRVRLTPATPHGPRGTRALRPTPDWELCCSVWAASLDRLPPQCRWMATGR